MLGTHPIVTNTRTAAALVRLYVGRDVTGSTARAEAQTVPSILGVFRHVPRAAHFVVDESDGLIGWGRWCIVVGAFAASLVGVLGLECLCRRGEDVWT